MALQRLMAPKKIFLRSRDHVAHIDRLTRFRVRHQAVIGILMLQIKKTGETARRSCKGRVIDNSRDLFGAEPDFSLSLQPLQNLFSRPCSHLAVPPVARPAASSNTAVYDSFHLCLLSFLYSFSRKTARREANGVIYNAISS